MITDKHKKAVLLIISLSFFSIYKSQTFNNEPILLSFPHNVLVEEIKNLEDSSITYIRPQIKRNKSKKFSLGYSLNYILNTGHPNIDNLGVHFTTGKKTSIQTIDFIYSTKYLSLKLSPYQITRKDNLYYSRIRSPFSYSNHQNNNERKFDKNGLRESVIILHYNGLGVSYGNMSNWWGPGFHSSLAFSSNSSNFRSIQIGNFYPIILKKIELNFRSLITQKTNFYNNPIFISGAIFSISYLSNPKLTLGLSRYHLSGGFDDFQNNNLKRSWTIQDAFKLIIEPLFGQSKRGLNYTNNNSAGYDKWDQVLTGFGEMHFTSSDLRIYFEVSSDDNRANFNDLRAHWDHTLGYLLGIRKYNNFGNYKLFFMAEYLSTKTSNTMQFWRGDLNQPNYYTRKEYDFSTYEGRRFGAHSGPSSDDLIFVGGFTYDKYLFSASINRERGGVKVYKHPEIKKEIAFTLSYKFSNHSKVNLQYEYEKIDNFLFELNESSISKILLIGYSFLF